MKPLNIARATALVVSLCLTATPLTAGAKLPVPVHPDTLPTLIRAWSLPASLAPYVTNAYAPRMALADALIYTYDHHGRRLVAAQASNGKVVWHAPVPARSDRAFAFTPFVYGGKVYVASDGYLFGFDALKGEKKLEIHLKGPAINGMARAKHRLFLPWVRVKGRTVQPGVQLWGIDSRSGRVEWAKKLPGSLAYVEGDSDGAYYVGDTGIVLKLTPDRGQAKWQLRVEGEASQPPVLHQQHLFIVTRLRKTGWSGSGVYCIDVRKGKLRWQTKIASKRLAIALYGDRLLVVDQRGKVTLYDEKGKAAQTIALSFGEPPTTVHTAVVGKRAYVFTSDPSGHGYIWLVDLAGKRLIAKANALDMRVRAMVPAAKMVFLDSAGGDLFGYRLDRSLRPKRRSVPAGEFAAELIERARRGLGSRRGLSEKLAGLGAQALPAIEAALAEESPHLVSATARAVALLGKRRSVPALLKALGRLSSTKGGGAGDPLLAVIDALARIRDSRAIGPLQKVMEDGALVHLRRRAAYVALGSIGTPAALAPIWTFRARAQLTTTKWEPVPYSASSAYRVERDYNADRWPDWLKKKTSVTTSSKSGESYTAALSPYLGGYNDIWIGRSDATGMMADPLFTGLTKPEIEPKQFIRLKQLNVSKGKARLRIEMRRGGKWIAARPVELPLADLARDGDGDGLTDVVERRLRLCVTHPDCDGDGLRDSEDVNPLASSKTEPTREQLLFREAFFAYFAFLDRRGVVVIDPGDGPSFEVYGRRDPVLALRRPEIERLRKEAGLHAVDFVSFGGPYPEGGGSGDALAAVVFSGRGRTAKLGLDIVRAGNNAVAYNVTLKRIGKNWVVVEMDRIWSTD